MEIEEIVTRCKLGEKEAFRELLQTVEKKALATAYFLSGNRGIAEDILQETYMKCFMEINKLQDPQAFKVWFFKILMRTGWKMTKKQSTLVPLEITSENEELFCDENQGRENIIDSYEIKHVMQSAINNLNPNLKTVIILYYYNDMSIDEISKVTGCFKTTVKSRLFYARAALSKEVEEKLNKAIDDDKAFEELEKDYKLSRIVSASYEDNEGHKFQLIPIKGEPKKHDTKVIKEVNIDGINCIVTQDIKFNYNEKENGETDLEHKPTSSEDRYYIDWSYDGISYGLPIGNKSSNIDAAIEFSKEYIKILKQK